MVQRIIALRLQSLQDFAVATVKPLNWPEEIKNLSLNSNWKNSGSNELHMMLKITAWACRPLWQCQYESQKENVHMNVYAVASAITWDDH